MAERNNTPEYQQKIIRETADRLAVFLIELVLFVEERYVQLSLEQQQELDREYGPTQEQVVRALVAQAVEHGIKRYKIGMAKDTDEIGVVSGRFEEIVQEIMGDKK